ncbi:MAG: beta-carotene hydroxylase [Bacteroidetes bacterium]|nr:beta-carotene hydroxylase [Bacteroidota bacterium]
MIYLLITAITFFAMEFVAWFTHKYVMHGFLWSWHRDHHIKEPGILEKNDRFFLVFAVPSATLFIIGATTDYVMPWYIGLGILLYGIAYFLVHEIFIHQRIKFFRNSKYRYFKAIRRAHKIHHKHITKEDGECFGMLVVPFKYWRETKGK